MNVAIKSVFFFLLLVAVANGKGIRGLNKEDRTRSRALKGGMGGMGGMGMGGMGMGGMGMGGMGMGGMGMGGMGGMGGMRRVKKI